ncbi:TIGR01777 family oxidoreductase [Microbacterium sp. ZW T5_56]|uniref:TIGR01777 family oxidoreductase n=1 Tax=Microbacterium sp. ZW T5_56 TaxID=3378081 RepID=UPI0038550280
MADQPLGPGDRVVVAGASGLIGRALIASLRGSGSVVTQLVRREPAANDEVRWDPAGPLDPAVLDGARAVVGLNGASIGRLPWTSRYRSELLWSRVTPTRTLADALRRLDDPPLFVAASASGFYGSRPGRRIDEDQARGVGFLADLCAEWEAAADHAGQRVAHVRLSPVIHPDGVLKPLMILARLGVAGPLGSGRQSWPWASLDDTVAALCHIIEHDLTGPVNVVGPERASENDIGFAIARELNRPYFIPMPAFALRLALGAAAEDLLLVDSDIAPAVLTDSGFEWRHRTAESAVRDALASPDR